MPTNRLNSFRFAFHGIAELFRTQANARIHLGITVATVAAGLFLKLDSTEWCMVILAISSVMAAEAYNTALEKLTDLISPHIHPLAGSAKDLAAGAVLITAFGAAIVGLVIFLPKIIG
ncbi:MAG: hypothetical protein RLY31_1881 [Bacteroidota bacterium]|jgi:diacylglycerol kinase (ATP)